MTGLKNYMTEIIWAISVLVFMIFTATNVTNRLGVTYLQFIFGWMILLFITLLLFDKRLEVTIKKNNTSWFEEGFYGAVGLIIILFASYALLNVFSAGTTFGAILSSLGVANPIFSDSLVLNFLIIAGAIPIIETSFFLRIAELFGDLIGVRITKSNLFALKFIVIVIVLSSLFAVFHATSKNLSGSALLIVGIMMAVTIYLTSYRDGDMRAAIITHVLANGVAAYLLLSSGGALNLGA